MTTPTETEKETTLYEWISLFTTVNNDCENLLQPPIPLDDIDYYSQQIHNLTDEQDWEHAVDMATQMAIEVSQ